MQVGSENHLALKNEVEAEVATRTAAVALPDSRFGRDFTQFIPGFEGADKAAEALMATAEGRAARWVFVTPDNAVAPVRQKLLEAGVDIVVPSYGLHRGFLRVEAADIPPAAARYAGWLDGIEHFGRSLTLEQLRGFGPIDLIATGAFAVTAQGLRLGMGDFYVDIEWCILRGLGLVDERTPIAAIVHDVQIADADVPVGSGAATVDMIVTPSRVLRPPRRARPSVLDWSIVPDALAQTATLQEFRTYQAR